MLTPKKPGESKKIVYDVGEVIAEGKTKTISAIVDQPDLVMITNKDAITAHDNAQFTRTFDSKAASATATTVNVFKFLKDCSMNVAFVEQVGPTQFVANKGEMIPLEVVARRHAVGSMLKRDPELAREGDIPYRFTNVRVEFFLKTKDGKFTDRHGEVHDLHLDPLKGEEDPIIANPGDETWVLHHPKMPISAETILGFVQADLVVCTSEEIKIMRDMTKQAFLLLEKAWEVLHHTLIDFKIEFAWGAENGLMIADVIDNDSWRLRDGDWQEQSKEVFRQNGLTDEVVAKYARIATLSELLRLPKQALVLWGEPTEQDETLATMCAFIDGLNILCEEEVEGDKTEQVNNLLSEYRGGGVILYCGPENEGSVIDDILWPIFVGLGEDPEENAASDKFSGIVTVLAINNPAAYAWMEMINDPDIDYADGDPVYDLEEIEEAKNDEVLDHGMTKKEIVEEAGNRG
ncbi:MAG: phosphoribosylaminoimidazolesuccinocarboxamide synthase [Candidatus Berkelbacteria bacterium]